MNCQRASVFIAPLVKLDGFPRDQPTNALVFDFLFRGSTPAPDISRESLLSFEFTKNRNGITLFFSDAVSGEIACKQISTIFPLVSTKLKILSSPPIIDIPVSGRDPFIPSGLHVLDDWLSVHDEERIMNEIDSLAWDTTIRRRVQHYGFRFKYSQLMADSDAPVSDFPPIIKSLVHERSELAMHEFDQLTVNEYVAGIGIASHCDTHSAFSDTIAVISLLNPITMDFVYHDGTRKVSVVIPPRSLFLMTGDSRYGWRHAIASRKSDVGTDGTPSPRLRRVSLTFRKIEPHECKCAFPSLCDSQGADLLRPRRMQSG
jgi:alkylated DNA repair dioxygenase AlkB